MLTTRQASKRKWYNNQVQTNYWRRLAPHHHTGQRLPHHQTSYVALLFLLILTGVILAGVSFAAGAEDDTGIQSSFQSFAVVPGPAPTVAPQITSLNDSQTVSSVPIAVSGSCPSNTLVKIFKNEVLAGAALCDTSQRFSMQIDPFIGSNALIARAYNTTDEVSPDSQTITVQYNPPGSQATANQLNAAGAPGNQFFITAQIYFRGAEAGRVTGWPLTITGGQPPYAVSVGWGDGTTDLYSRATAGPFDVSHTYGKAGSGYRGSYPVIVEGTDAANAHAYLQLVALISNTNTKTAIAGGTSGSGSAKGGLPFSSGLSIAWPLFGAAVLMVLSFLLGEWREKRVFSKNQTPQIQA